MRKLLLFVLLVGLLVGCRKNDVEGNLTTNSLQSYSGQYLRNYFTLLCKISQTTPGFFPPQVSRAYGYVGMANYEAVVNGISPSFSLAGQINSLQSSDLPHPEPGKIYNWALASNSAVAGIMRKMFEKTISANNTRLIDSAEKANFNALAVRENSDVVARSVDFGKAIATAIYRFSMKDGAHESYLDPFQLPYSLPTDISCWVPTGSVQNPIAPLWGKNATCLSANNTLAKNFVPAKFSTDQASEFYKEALAVYNQVKKNTPEQIEIAKYWADDPFNTCTPTGHTFGILTQLLQENNATLEKTSVAYAKMCIAQMDAFIACWSTKYETVLIRPVSYIQKYIDPSFRTVIGTPPFPAFTSGHSAEIGAGTQIMIDLFTNGSGNYNFTDYSQLQYGFAARRYTNFNEMAEECALSRFYGGIHYPMDNEKGLELGRAVGNNVNKLLSFPRSIR
jgi:hypothetical protein